MMICNQNSSKQGFTLVELLVYIAIVGIVVLVAGQAFSDSTKFRVRTQNMLKAGEMANSAAELLKEDIAQMGAKSNLTSTGNIEVEGDVFMDASNGDYSSFSLTRSASNGNYSDELITKRARYNLDGSVDAVEQVTWALDGNRNLVRTCKTISGNSLEGECGDDNGTSVVVASGVKSFSIVPSVHVFGTGTGGKRIFPDADESVENFGLVSRFGVTDDGGTSYSRVVFEGDDAAGYVGAYAKNIRMSGFASNYDFSNNQADASSKKASQVYAANQATLDWSSCYKMNFKKGVTYRVSFSMGYYEDASRLFVIGRDHFSVGLRNNGAKIANAGDDFMFIPPTETNAPRERYFLLTPKGDINDACLAFTFVTYSPEGKFINLSMTKLVVEEVATSTYAFNDAKMTFSTAEKKNVQALKIVLEIEKNNEMGSTTIVVPVPSNGEGDQ